MTPLPTIEETILAVVADPSTTRKDVAVEYGFGLYATQDVDWKRVNAAILDRWSMAGLRYIKERAWRLVAAQKS